MNSVEKVDFDIGSHTFAYEIAYGMMIFAWGWSKRKKKTKILDSFAMEGTTSYHSILFLQK